jgi:glycosyltransferase involved in cell wall biosynthesis
MITKPRVLIIVQNLPVPFDRRVWLEATTLQRNGYSVSVISPKLKGCKRSVERRDGIDVYRYALPVQGRGALTFAAEFAWCFLSSALLSLRVYFRGRGFDVIHACNPPDVYWILGAVWGIAGKSFVFDHHDLCPEMYEAKFSRTGGVLHRVLRWFERQSFQTAEVVIAPNESHAEIARGRGGVEPDRTFVVRSGPDTARLTVRTPEPMLKRGRRFLCTYLGEMCAQDGVHRLVYAVRLLCIDRARQDISFCFLGGGPEQPKLVRLAGELGVSEFCDFRGVVSDDELCRYLSTTDVAVDPTPRSEWSDRSTMNKIMEYMFFGCPIVAFDLRESRRTAAAAAMYVTGETTEELADQIEFLLGSEDVRAEMGAYAKRRVRDSLMWAHSEPHLLQAYRRLTGAVQNSREQLSRSAEASPQRSVR